MELAADDSMKAYGTENARDAPDTTPGISLPFKYGSAVLRAKDMALAYSRQPKIMQLPAYPIFRRHHTDPRWLQLLDKIKFPLLRRS